VNPVLWESGYEYRCNCIDNIYVKSITKLQILRLKAKNIRDTVLINNIVKNIDSCSGYCKDFMCEGDCQYRNTCSLAPKRTRHMAGK
jgi:hypothetical protein